MKELFKFSLVIFICVQATMISAQVTPLLTTTWNQGCNYNADCPTTGSGGACGKVWTGCNATAMAQIFKYYNYPSSGMGDHCNTNDPGHCVDFSLQTYNYASMPNNVSTANTEVAKLMYHLGVSVDMQWSGTSSNSFFSQIPFKKYFKYSPRLYGTSTFMFNTTQELIDGIKAELNAGRPVYAKGGNHFYLIDGYNTSDQFHMNFGWGGTYDGYYDITSVVNGAGTFTPVNFIFNIKPLAGDLETATDSIFIGAYPSTNSIDFTSLQNWTMTTDVSWIDLNLTSGTEGYYSSAEGSTFDGSTNNGSLRYGYIFIDNGNDVDTIVVEQSASPLIVNPDTLYFTASGGTENISMDTQSWSTWNATTPDSWITLSQTSGTGDGTISVTCSTNPLTTTRNSIIVFTSGAFSDTVFIEQDANSAAWLSDLKHENNIVLYPNPANEFINIDSPHPDLSVAELYDFRGQLLYSTTINDVNNSVDLSTLENGTYFMKLKMGDETVVRKFVVIK
ncbi:MAG: C10 family peptidase [Brumimicrobium sp.]|nr:C10 family peptidase [Brumimicrobium sp.]